MCAIIGYIAKRGQTLPIKQIKRMVDGNEHRGGDAFGFSWIEADGRLRMYKQKGKLASHIGALAMARKAIMFIGHLRWSTHGSESANINNHPHPCDGGWLVHNGIVTNYATLVREHALWMNSQCDTEVIGLLAEQSSGTTPMHRVADAIDRTDGSLAAMFLFKGPPRLMVAKRGNPLHVSETDIGKFLATLPEGMPGHIKVMKPDRILEYSYNKARDLSISWMDLEAKKSAFFGGFDDGSYGDSCSWEGFRRSVDQEWWDARFGTKAPAKEIISPAPEPMKTTPVEVTEAETSATDSTPIKGNDIEGSAIVHHRRGKRSLRARPGWREVKPGLFRQVY